MQFLTEVRFTPHVGEMQFRATATSPPHENAGCGLASVRIASLNSCDKMQQPRISAHVSSTS